VSLNLYFIMSIGKKFITNKQQIFRLFLKKIKDGKFFYKLKKLKEKAKEKNYFREICAKKDQQQNGQRQKGPQQNGPCQSGCVIKLHT